MNYAQKLNQVSLDDPDFARAIKRNRGATVMLGLAVLIAIAVGISAVVVNSRQDTQINTITKVERTVCTTHPGSHECAQIRQRVAEVEPIRGPCILHQRVEGTKGRNCPRFYVKPPN